MGDTTEALWMKSEVASDPFARELAVIATCETGRTTSGHPYLVEPAWVRFRDWVPHTLDDGPRVIDALAVVERALASLTLDDEMRARAADACSVVRQVVQTAAITAPPDLWLLRHVLATFARRGLSSLLAKGEVLAPAVVASSHGLLRDELAIDLRLLLARGLLRVTPDGFRAADHARARACFAWTPVTDARWPSTLTELWRRALVDGGDDDVRATLVDLAATPLPLRVPSQGGWAPGPREIEVGFREVPLVLALRATHKTRALVDAGQVTGTFADPAIDRAAQTVLHDAGVVDRGGALTVVGRRVLERGPGPFGIIETYHAYMARLDEIWTKGRASVWVERTANVAASQDANRASFERANDALDRFVKDTGFTYRVFIEHALGKGEATRQRFSRAGDALTYVGADLEDAAIDAAVVEQQKGHLPRAMHFVRQADIGAPDVLARALDDAGVSMQGAVMIVGNGFHEVREQTDDKMTRILSGYAQKGVVLLFTEETGLGVDDLLHTAWNTYHAGFKYVHERSGQGLRPAERRPPTPLDTALPRSWVECAERAGYVRLDAYSPRGRTVYPYTPTSGHNPSISVTHFCVPRALADSLGL